MTGDDRTLYTESAVSAFTGDPFVVMRWGKESAQMTPAEARQTALHMIECADVAEADAHLMAVFREHDLDEHVAVQVLQEIRERRAAAAS